MTETPETHYVKSDDLYIAYQVLGDGPFDLLFVPGFVSNVEAAWRSPDQSAFFRRLASFCRLILFDKRGTGMSDEALKILRLSSGCMMFKRYLMRLAANKRHCSVFRKAAQCPCFMRPL